MNLSKISFPFFLLVCICLSSCQNQVANKTNQKPATEKQVVKTKNPSERDSLLQRAINQNDYEKAYQLQLETYRANYSSYDKKQLKTVLKNLREFGQNSKKVKFIAQSNYKTAHFFKSEEVYDSAYYYYYAAQKNYFTIKDSLGVAKSFISLGEIQISTGDYFGAEQSEIKALNYLNPDQKRYRLAVYNLLAITGKKQKNYDAALKWYDKALAIDTTSKYAPLIAVNKGSVLLRKNENEKAHAMFSKLAEKKILKLTDERRSTVLDFWGLSKTRLNLKNGLAMMQEAKTIRENADLRGGLVLSYLHLATYFKNRDKPLALDYAQKAVKLASNPDRILSGLKLVAEISSVNGKKAFQRYIALNDSLVTARGLVVDKFAKIRFESEQQEKQISQLQSTTALQSLTIQQGENTKTLYLLVILFSIILFILTFIFLRSRHRKNKELAISSTENKLSKRMHDEVANEVYQLMDAVQYKIDMTKERLLDNLEDIYSKTRDISREIKSVDLLKDYPVKLKDMIGSYQTSEISVLLKNFSKEHFGNLDSKQKICLYRVLQELMTNMKKHSEADLVLVIFEKNENFLKIDYRDNGKGFTLKNKKFEDGGLQNVENRINSNNGSLNFDHSPKRGVRIRMHFFIK